MSSAPAGDEGPRPRPQAPAEPRVSFRAELDPPGDTRRQVRVFAIWAACLAMAVAAGIALRARVPLGEELSPVGRAEVSRSRMARLEAAVLFGLLLPACLTYALARHYRRGGGHARGIVIDVQGEELRLWGRGYGARVVLPGARLEERLVDVYAGRLGAWRQRRMRISSAGVPRIGVRELELATVAVEGDEASGMRAEGGEGDCVELRREDYEALRAELLSTARGTLPARTGQAAPDRGADPALGAMDAELRSPSRSPSAD